MDVLGNFQDAVQLTKELVGIRGDAVLVYPEKGSLALLERLVDSGANSLERLTEGFKSHIEYRWPGFSGALALKKTTDVPFPLPNDFRLIIYQRDHARWILRKHPSVNDYVNL